MAEGVIAVILSILVLPTVLTARSITRGVDEDTSNSGNVISGVATKAQR